MWVRKYFRSINIWSPERFWDHKDFRSQKYTDTIILETNFKTYLKLKFYMQEYTWLVCQIILKW